VTPATSRPWWAEAPPGELTRVAEARAEAMSRTTEGRLVKGQVNDL
jgi:hypothetical protein